jgi:hypothetical protein
MDENFEYRPLLDRDTLRILQQRQDVPSLIHLTLHLGTFALCMGLVAKESSRWFTVDSDGKGKNCGMSETLLTRSYGL